MQPIQHVELGFRLNHRNQQWPPWYRIPLLRAPTSPKQWTLCNTLAVPFKAEGTKGQEVRDDLCSKRSGSQAYPMLNEMKDPIWQHAHGFDYIASDHYTQQSNTLHSSVFHNTTRCHLQSSQCNLHLASYQKPCHKWRMFCVVCLAVALSKNWEKCEIQIVLVPNWMLSQSEYFSHSF